MNDEDIVETFKWFFIKISSNLVSFFFWLRMLPHKESSRDPKYTFSIMCYLLNIPPPYSPAIRHREQFCTALVEFPNEFLLKRRLKGIHHTKKTRCCDVLKNPVFSDMMRMLPHWKHQSNFPRHQASTWQRSHWCPFRPSLITCSCFSISLGFQPSQFDPFTLFNTSTYKLMSLQFDTSDDNNSDYLDTKCSLMWTLYTDYCCPTMASSQAFWHATNTSKEWLSTPQGQGTWSPNSLEGSTASVLPNTALHLHNIQGVGFIVVDDPCML